MCGKLIYTKSTLKHKKGDIVDGYWLGGRWKIIFGSSENDYILYDSLYPVMDLEEWRESQIDKILNI